MKILVNTRLLIENNFDGIAWFTYETLKRIVLLNPQHEFIFAFDRKFSDKFLFAQNIKPVTIFPPARHPVLWFWWFEFSLKKIIRNENPDIMFSPDGFITLRSKTKTVTVIHDINFFHRPKDLPLFSRYFYNTFFPKYARKADKIITVSEFSKSDIVSSYNISPEKISVAYNGFDKNYVPLSPENIKNTQQKISFGKKYFVFVGSLHPRKNIPALFKAFDIYKTQTGSDYKLVIVGKKMFLNKNLHKTYKNLKFGNDIIFTGKIPQNELYSVTASAQAMVFVPFFEGFGIPILEAMACNVPVICSNTSSLPEVAGDAALFVNPNSVNEIAQAMKTLTNIKEIRELLIKKGKIQAQKFSWDKTASTVWNIITKTFENAK